MMYISPWLQAVLLPEKWDVCGVICRPVSVWHLYILLSVQNPFIFGGKYGNDAVTEVLMYCCGDMAHGKRMYNDKRYMASVANRIIKAVNKAGKSYASKAVEEYTAECLRSPTHKKIIASSTGEKTKPLSAPVPWVLVDFLSAGNPDKIEAAWNTPYVTARCLFDARRNQSGDDDSLISEADEERIDAKVEKMAQARKAK
jgi:DNA-binding FrmR family transcriptional regulator